MPTRCAVSLFRRGLASLLAVASALSLVVVGGCLEPPGVGRAADPAGADGPAPWGSATSNAELDKKVKLLGDILDARVKPADLPARIAADYPDLNPDQRKRTLASLSTLLEDLKRSGREGIAVPQGPERDMAFAQLYFGERRFIEAATLLSKVLDANPTQPGARNLLARCFFFLQNRDRTISELEFVLQHPTHQKDQEEILDALFLLGAAVAETPGMSRANLQKGKDAWERYLKLAPDSPQRAHVEKGLAEIEAGLAGEGRLAQPLAVRATEGNAAAPRNVLGGSRSFAGTGSTAGATGEPPAPQERRLAKLGPDATPFDRAVAEGLDALDAKDLALAEKQLGIALREKPTSPEALTGMGRVFVQTGRIADAVRSFGEAIKVAPDYVPAWHYNGMAHLMSGSPGEAVKSWQKVVEKDPAYAARYQLGQRIEVAKRMGG